MEEVKIVIGTHIPQPNEQPHARRRRPVRCEQFFERGKEGEGLSVREGPTNGSVHSNDHAVPQGETDAVDGATCAGRVEPHVTCDVRDAFLQYVGVMKMRAESEAYVLAGPPVFGARFYERPRFRVIIHVRLAKRTAEVLWQQRCDRQCEGYRACTRIHFGSVGKSSPLDDVV